MGTPSPRLVSNWLTSRWACSAACRRSTSACSNRRRLGQADSQRLDLLAAAALHLQRPLQLGHDELLAVGDAILQARRA